MKKMIQVITDLFKPSSETLWKEAEERANERFNIVQKDGLSYIKYCDVIVSPAKYGNATNELLETLYELRKMYAEEYVKREGRY